MNKKRKRYIVICIIILLLFSYWMFRYNSLEKKLIIGNINHIFDVDFLGADIDKEEKLISISFKERFSDEKARKVINELLDDCKKIVYKNKSYRDYNFKIMIYAPSKKDLFIITVNPDGKVEKIYCAINGYRTAFPIFAISQDYSEVKELYLDDIHRYSSPYPEDSSKIIKNDYSNVDDYKKFTSLEYVRFSMHPGDEVINYLKKQFPKCIIEVEDNYNNKILKMN